MFSRRQFLGTCGGLGAAALVIGVLPKFAASSALVSDARAAEVFEVTHSDSEWRAMLSAGQYEILREEGTERAYSSPLNNEHRDGIFACAGCDLPLFSSRPSSTAVPVGRASGRRWTRPWPSTRTTPSAWSAKKFTVDAAVAT
jgi:peptide-methionine (R)-S-oxide reductase